ncbi:MAG TPA: T9SS type A sorting domain-containing protein, partial [Candidatus Krumholzibacteria bacterium]|nr:T9SS type A sorting domain-containing protein [Candidatus Krumholzibacteria bacterium]
NGLVGNHVPIIVDAYSNGVGRGFRGIGYIKVLPEEALAASAVSLQQNAPNPFNPQTTIPYTVPPGSAPVHVRLAIYDTVGRLVRVLVDENQGGGARETVWNGNDTSGATVSSGVYLCVLQVGKQRLTQKLVLLK